MPNIVSPEMITEPNQIAPYIQHTKIGIGTTKEESIRHAEEAAEFGFNAAMG